MDAGKQSNWLIIILGETLSTGKKDLQPGSVSSLPTNQVSAT